MDRIDGAFTVRSKKSSFPAVPFEAEERDHLAQPDELADRPGQLDQRSIGELRPQMLHELATSARRTGIRPEQCFRQIESG